MYLVTGGFYFIGPLDTTEILSHGAEAKEWVTVGSLPSPRYGLKAAVINNRLIVTGVLQLRMDLTFADIPSHKMLNLWWVGGGGGWVATKFNVSSRQGFKL